MSETKHLSFTDDDYLKEKIQENLKMFRINFDKPAKYEMNIQDISTAYTSIKELGNVILNRYLSEE